MRELAEKEGMFNDFVGYVHQNPGFRAVWNDRERRLIENRKRLSPDKVYDFWLKEVEDALKKLDQLGKNESKCLDMNKFSVNFRNIFSFDKAKNGDIAIVLTSIFNDVKRKKKLKFVEVICVQALK